MSEPFDGLSDAELARIMFIAMKGSGGDAYFDMRWKLEEDGIAAVDGNVDLVALGRYVRMAAKQDADYWERRQALKERRDTE